MKTNGVLGVIINNNKKVFLVKRSDIPLWTLPGGDIENIETPEQAIIRELREETGLNIKIVKNLGYHERIDIEKRRKDNKLYICQTFLCEILSGKFNPNDEIYEIRYYNIKYLPHDLTRWHKNIIYDSFKKIYQKNLPKKFKKIKMNLINELLWLIIHPLILFKITSLLLKKIS